VQQSGLDLSDRIRTRCGIGKPRCPWPKRPCNRTRARILAIRWDWRIIAPAAIGRRLETLEANLKDQVDWALAYDLYFLAMCHQQLGDSARARQCFDLALRWSASHQESLAPYVAELTAFRAEASELLGIGKKKN